METIVKKYLIAALSFIFCVSVYSIKPVYVSSRGNDSGDGTLKHPFLTLEKARDVIRAKRISDQTGNVSILLMEGDYYFTHALALTKEDRNLTIASYKGGKVRFTGGISVDPSSVRPVTGSDKEGIFPEQNRAHIGMVNLGKLGITDYGSLKQIGFGHALAPSWMELFINGEPGHLSRWPNDSSVAIGKVIDKGSVAANGDTGGKGARFTYPGNRPSGWKASDDIWIFGYFKYGWADDAVKIAHIDTLEQIFTTVQPHIYGFSSGRSWNAWYAYNLPEEIDVPGEYYIDRHQGILYFYNPGRIDHLEVSVLEEPFITMDSSADIVINGIDFECARGIGVDMKSTTRCVLENCTFRNLGMYAVNISDAEGGSVGKNNGLLNCLICQTGAGGVRLFGGNRQTLEPAGNFVENCSIHDYNRIVKTYCAGVQISGVGNHIAHCEIYNAPHTAILLSGNDHLIEYNNIHDVCTETDDVGAIYYGRNPSERGHLVRYNYFHNISAVHSTSAVYHDDGACGMEVLGNVFYKAGKMPALIGGGSDDPYINNIFIDSPCAIHIDDRLQSASWAKPWVEPGNKFEKDLDNIKYDQPPYSLRYPELAKYWSDNPALPKRDRVDKNVFVRITEVIKGDKKWLDYTDNNFVTDKDPGFVSEKDQNFKLRESSEVFKKIPGFQQIPFEKIGIIKNR